MKLFTTIRNNWKKSLVGFAFVTYGTNYLYDRKETNRLHQAYCIEADKFNKQKLKPGERLPRVTVFLNPISNNDQSKVVYEKYAAPLLHLSGLDVRLVRLDAKNEITDLMQLIDDSQTDCIVIAGGNRTIIECLTSLLKRNDDLLKRIKIGVIPLGENNSLVEKLFKTPSTKNQVKLIGDSCLSVIRQKSEKLSAFKIHIFNDDKTTEIYAFSNISCGFEADSRATKEHYWAYGPFKAHINDYFKLRNALHKPNRFDLTVKNFCDGCKACFYSKENLVDASKVLRIEPKNIAQFFFKKFIADNRNQVEVEKKRSKYPVNVDCNVEHAMCVERSQIDIDINSGGLTADGMGLVGKMLNKDGNVGNELKLNLNELRFDRLVNVNKIAIDNELYDLNNTKQITIQYMHKHIDFLFDSSCQSLLTADKSKQNDFNASRFSIDSYATMASPSDLIQPFRRFYESYLKL